MKDIFHERNYHLGTKNEPFFHAFCSHHIKDFFSMDVLVK